ncbi:MAG: SDR family NAD(P)-dependent oxidoreductase [Rubrivivax sp.]
MAGRCTICHLIDLFMTPRRPHMPSCLITGAASGIGRAVALLAAERGYAVGIADLPAARAGMDAVCEQIVRAGGTAVPLLMDVSRPEDIVAAHEAFEARCGRLSALVNAAGVYLESEVAALQADALDRLFAVNTIGLMLNCREAVRRMSNVLGGSGGAIVNVSSMAATIGGRPGACAYAASKGAVDVFTTGFAREVAGQGIRVNTVRPGVTATGMTPQLELDADLRRRVEASIPMGRIGQPQEVAALIVWLLSAEASFVTGAHVNVGGGGFLVASMH